MVKMKKIFLVSEYIFPTQNTTGYLLHKLYKSLHQQYGEHLTLIVKDDPENLIDDAILVANINLNKKKLVQRLAFELILSFNFFIKILFNVKKDDVLLNVTNPSLLLPVIYLAKKIKGFRWILLVHDVFPENLAAAKILKKENIVYNILKILFDKFYNAAEIRIVIGKDMKELVDKKVNKDDSIIIQNWIDHHDIEVQEKKDNQILKKISWHNEILVLNFFGNIGRVQGIDNIINALRLIPIGKRPKILFIGGGAYENELKAAIYDLKDDNIQYIGSLDPIKKSDGLNACDISIVTLADGMYGLGVPSKAYYSMAADKPILAIMDEESEISVMVKKHRIGWTVPAGDPEKLAKVLLDISQDARNLSMNSPRKVLIEHYSELVAMRKITDVIDQIF